jgi:centrosomal protein CEP104
MLVMLAATWLIVQDMEAELARKERELGPDHPAVADCLSNIAILYNQSGESDKALPMYERALAIFEKARGPMSQDVAHTLTDLAVLHLEAQRDAVGRPLLERALAIQTELLGADHPDVMAILDVLNGE